MHEQALFRDLRRKLVELARQHPQEEVLRVRIGIGALSHVEENALRRAWPDIVQGTAAESAELIIEAPLAADDPRAQSLVLSSLDLGAGRTRPRSPSENAKEQEGGRCA